MAYEDENVLMLFDSLDIKSEKTISSLKNELSTMRVGRANPKILDKVYVDYYGTKTPICQVANITIPEARLLVVNVWDTSIIKSVEKAIIDANLGIFPSNDGKVIRMVFPELNEERRKTLVKEIKSLSESSKVALRNIRRDVLSKMRSLEKDKLMTEDDLKVYEKDLDKKVSDFVSEVDKIIAEKEQEIMKI